MMFRAMAGRLKQVNDRTNNISEAIIRDLACRIFFDGLLHPIPSSTVLKYTTGSSQTSIDDSTEACWVNTAVKPSVTFYFSPVESKDLHPIEAVIALARNGDGAHILWTDPQWASQREIPAGFDPSSVSIEADGKDCLFIGLKRGKEDIEVRSTDIFIAASSELLGLLRWSRWKITDRDGTFDRWYIPAVESLKRIERKRVIPEPALWGHSYFPHEHIEEYQDNFFPLPASSPCEPPGVLRQAFPEVGEDFWGGLEPLSWIQVVSDKRLPMDELKSFELAATNCLVAINTHFQKQNYFYHGPGPMTLELQQPAGEIYEIIRIDDNNGREYSNIYGTPSVGDPQCRYVPRIKGDVLQLLVIPPEAGKAPDRFSVEYRTSTGQSANGMGPGKIDSLYNPHPGLESIVNLTATRGGVFARAFEDMLAAFPNMLRSHNRAVVSSDFETLALTFDSRIKSAKANLGSAKRKGILFRAVEVEVNLGDYRFAPPEEETLFLARLQRYLETRSPMGTVVVAMFSA